MSDIILAQRPRWLQYFRPFEALQEVAAHIAGLPSSLTDEQHTMKSYQAGLEYFIRYMADAHKDELPTANAVKAFIAHLAMEKGLKSSTIGSKYMAPMRHYLNALADQMINVTSDNHIFVSDCREQLRKAAKVPTPKPQTTTNIAPLWRPEFVRLSINQVNALLRQIDRSGIAGKRDYALLHIAFSTGLRLAEMARITLDSITPAGDGLYLISVRGKRSNVDPVPISAEAHADLMAYISAFNADLAPDDPRLIRSDVPVWQPLQRYGGHMPAKYNPCDGLSKQSIRDMIAKRSAVLGEQFTLAPHDTRRTAAAIAHDSGMDITDIQALLRHKDPAITLHYVGKKPDYASRSLARRVSFG